MLLPFSFLVLCLFSVAVGWRFQVRFLARPHWILLIFMPLFPIVAIPLVGLYIYGQRILINFLLLQLSFSITLIVFLVLQGLLLFLAMIILAGQRND
jgi:endonuclease/exonuclease/phosphatase (EEP) superfamily protein YafD